MTIQELLASLTPLNSKEKIDTLIRLLKENSIRMTPNNDCTIRLSIQKLTIQKYYAESYSGLFKEKEIIEHKNIRTLNKIGHTQTSNNSPKQSAQESNPQEMQITKSPYGLTKKSKKELKREKREKRERIQREQEEFNRKMLRKKREEEEANLSSAMRVFGAQYKEKQKKKRYQSKLSQGEAVKRIAYTSTSKSINAISIASGGLNKRY